MCFCNVQFLFQTDLECRSHMRKEDHLPYLPPLKIAGYICPQCLAIFENFETCWNHITEMSHRFVSYPFAGKFQQHGFDKNMTKSQIARKTFELWCNLDLLNAFAEESILCFFFVNLDFQARIPMIYPHSQ